MTHPSPWENLLECVIFRSMQCCLYISAMIKKAKEVFWEIVMDFGINDTI